MKGVGLSSFRTCLAGSPRDIVAVEGVYFG
jgi:hypothetical protein